MTDINGEFAYGNNLNSYRGQSYYNSDATSGTFSGGTIAYSDFYNKQRYIGSATATGGTVSVASGYKIHIFTSSGTFTISSGGAVVDYLIVGGGGGGAQVGGGGGGGGVVAGSVTLGPGSYSVTVGAGGIYSGSSYGIVDGQNGYNSVFNGITAYGGGGGKHGQNGTMRPHPAGDPNGLYSTNGGSGGGGAYSLGYGRGVAGQGYDGVDVPGVVGGGGGGGGSNPNQDGGPGYASSITGTVVYYAGGGGGGGSNAQQYGPKGNGGIGGGGAGRGAADGKTGGDGTNGLGGGAGGGGQDKQALYGGGTGGSGVVIVRYALG
jgi:hypothetical protein